MCTQSNLTPIRERIQVVRLADVDDIHLHAPWHDGCLVRSAPTLVVNFGLGHISGGIIAVEGPKDAEAFAQAVMKQKARVIEESLDTNPPPTPLAQALGLGGVMMPMMVQAPMPQQMGAAANNASGSGDDLVEKLGQLNQLYQSGALDKGQFERAKQKILAQQEGSALL
jgi:hypothetical protein